MSHEAPVKARTFRLTGSAVYPELMSQLCRQCHAEIAESANLAACPGCGGELIAPADLDLDPVGAPPRPVDHRGILLPRRHAVGGVITPR